MGRIKSKLIKRTGRNLLGEENNFSEKFEDNKVLLKGLTQSKKMRNQIAGYIARKLKAPNKNKKVAPQYGRERVE